MRIKQGLQVLLLVLSVALSGAACTDEPSRDESGEINETEDVDPNALKAGDCFNSPANESDTEVTSLKAVPCDEAHDNEVFHVFDLDAAEFPGDDEVKEMGQQGCEAELEEYVGASAQEAGLLLVPVTPTEDSWNEFEDRTVLCALHKADGSKMTGSLEGTGADPVPEG